MYRVSVIIPVFNGSDYLEDRLMRVLAQDIGSIEIIIVDDGSTDNSAQIVLSCFRKVDRKDILTRLIAQENMGVSVARNVGFSHANGKYVIFFDADDLMEKTFVRRMYERAEETDADLVLCGHFRVMENGKLVKEFTTSFFPKVVDGRDEEYLPFLGMSNPWTGSLLYRREFLKKNSLRYQPGCTNGEDTELIWKAWLLASRIACVPETLVSYVLREQTASRGNTLKRFHSIGALRRIRSFLSKNNCTPKLLDYFDRKVIPEAFMTILASLIYEGFPKDKIYQILRNSSIKKEISKFKPNTRNERIKSILFKRIPSAFFWYYSIQQERLSK